MDYHKSYYLMFIGMGVGLLMWLLFQFSTVMLVTGLISVCGGLAQTLIFFRCPHCRELWNIRGGIPKFCPHCGKEIE